jgi:hypothetical protein
MNMSKLSKIALAVAFALGGGSAMALDQATTNAAPTQLVVAGASAARDSMLLVVATELCQAGTVDVYRATPTGGQDFRAYSCTLVVDDGVSGSVANTLAINGVAGTNATIYYRSEGGSVWGPGSIVARQLNGSFPGIKSLDTTQACNAPVATNFTIGGTVLNLPTRNCPVAYSGFTTDAGTGAIVDKQTQFGVSDVEPKMFAGTNVGWPQSSKFPTYNAAIGQALKDLPKDTAFGQTFGFFINTTGPVSGGLLNITPAQATAIFTTGGYANWNKIPGLGSATIRKARREPGSGTQAAVAAFLANINCGDSLGFVTQTSPTSPTQEFSTSSDLNTFVSTTPEAIGFGVYTTSPPANTRFLKINGVDGDRQAAADGTYELAYELTTQKNPDPSILVPGSNSAGLATALQTILKRAATLPDNVSVFAIPGGTNVAGVPQAGRPVARASRNGNSCVPFQGK